MAVSTFRELADHVGHAIEVATYGDPPVNAAVECMDCHVVLLDFDEEEGDDG